MPTKHILAKLEQRYKDLERVGESVYRAVDRFEGRPYAIRYFDVSDTLLDTSVHLHEYQSALLGTSYYNSESRTDLRWNHYLYFVTSTADYSSDAFLRAKAAVESDREYARKIVVPESKLDFILNRVPTGFDSALGLPPDALTIWTDFLEQRDLGFIVDETLQVPTIVRTIAEGERKALVRSPSMPELSAAERAVSDDFLANIEIHKFRTYPLRKSFEFGDVNLIVGVNGVGKTSLLEAIEYLFCGKTRRAGAVPHASVSGVLANSQLTLETKATTQPAKLRSRNLAWYGKSEIRTLTLADSFSKFNFLDTDAAVRLTLDESSERISEDLAQLLLGAESARALDRFERVDGQLHEQRKVLESQIGARELRRADATARIEQLRATPQRSDALFSDLVLVLSEIGWIQTLTSKNDANLLTKPLQAALANVGILKAATALPDNLEELERSVSALIELENAVEKLSNQDVARKEEENQANLRLDVLGKRMEAIDALSPIVASGVAQAYRNSELLERQIGERVSTLVDAEAAVSVLGTNKAIRRMTLSRALSEWSEHVRSGNARTESAKTALSTLEQTQHVLRSLQQRLQSTARDLLEHTRDDKHCPLCRAEYSKAELKRRLDELAQGLEAEESDRLRGELKAAEAQSQERSTELRALNALKRYAGGDADKASIDAIIRRVTQDRIEVDTLQAELEDVRATLLVNKQKGWTFERLMEFAAAADLDAGNMAPENMDTARAAIRAEQNDLFNALQTLKASNADMRGRLAEIGIKYELKNPTPSELLQALSTRRRAGEDKRRATFALANQLLDFDGSLATEVESRLREAQDLAVQLRTALAKEQQDSDAIARETRLLNDAVAEIEGDRVRLKRVDSAIAVIQELLSKQSEKLLTEKVIHENASQIALTFEKIHAPNEFDLEVNGGLNIMRRGYGKVDLDEMSSGQRAAYAISLFLAMNGRLSTGPKVLVFDDPVAHVDDINTLSLLDHLRDVVLTRRRQLFFATADSKIAALFARKFGFLGDRFRQIELTRG